MAPGSKKTTITTALALVMVFFISCGQRSQTEAAPLMLSGATMGTTWRVTLIPPPLESPTWQEWIESELEAVNQAMSTYLEDSDLSRLARGQAGEPISVSPLTWECLQIARRVHEQSGGAFEPTVGPLVRLWGFGPGRIPGQTQVAAPKEEVLLAALQSVGLAALQQDPDRRTLLASEPKIELDLSAIAKGFAVDRVMERLQAEGVEHALVEVGGELRALGQRPGGGPWRLLVEDPFPGSVQFISRVALQDRALATSGDYRNFRVLPDGSAVSHTIDPRSGRPVSKPPASASVLAPTCSLADAWATALSVLGEPGLAIIEAQSQLEARLVLHPASPDGEPQVLTTSGW